MNDSIKTDIRNSANKITDNIRKESANISKSAIDMGKDIQNNIGYATLKARQIGRRTMSNAEGLVNDTRIRVGNKANEIQQQAIEMKDNEFVQDCFNTFIELKKQFYEQNNDLI